MMQHIAFILIIGITLVSSHKLPTISSITDKPIKKLGEQATLSCVAHYASTFSVSWIKLGRNKTVEPIILTSGDTNVIDNPRFSLENDPDNSIYSLQINDIQETDDGFYRCEMSVDSYENISAEIELAVIHPAFIYDNSSRSMVVPEDQKVILECYAGGFPAPKVYWRRRDHKSLFTGRTSHGGNILEIPSIKKNHRGIYNCYAENGVGRIAHRSISISVLFAPVVTVPIPRIGQKLSKDIDLSCRVEAYPPPAILWFFKEVPLSRNRHYSIFRDFKNDDVIETTLSITSIGFRQYGVYTCQALNVYGTVEANVELYEKITPA